MREQLGLGTQRNIEHGAAAWSPAVVQHATLCGTGEGAVDVKGGGVCACLYFVGDASPSQNPGPASPPRGKCHDAHLPDHCSHFETSIPSTLADSYG